MLQLRPGRRGGGAGPGHLRRHPVPGVRRAEAEQDLAQQERAHRHPGRPRHPRQGLRAVQGGHTGNKLQPIWLGLVLVNSE